MGHGGQFARGLHLFAPVGGDFDQAVFAQHVGQAQRLLDLPDDAVARGEDELAAGDERFLEGGHGLALHEIGAQHLGLAESGVQAGGGRSVRRALGLGVHRGRLRQQDERGDGGCSQAHRRPSTRSTSAFGLTNCNSPPAMLTATCTVLPRVRRSPLSRSRIS